MTIKAGARVALIAAGLIVCVTGVSWTVAASNAAESQSEYVSTSQKVKQVRYHKRYAHRKYIRTAQAPSEQNKPAQTEVAEAGLPTELPASIANANARMGGEIADDTARAMTARATAFLVSDQPTEAQGAVTTTQLAEADQLNEADKTLQEPTPPSQNTVAVAPTRPATAAAKPAPSETSTWDQTSLIGKIFIAFGALLTIASAARMFMA
jgi:hypothetical protein